MRGKDPSVHYIYFNPPASFQGTADAVQGVHRNEQCVRNDHTLSANPLNSVLLNPLRFSHGAVSENNLRAQWM